ncbi:MAG: hypothetical protein AVO35_10390 [Candidatus Aegiribacteria sp. MLS_C]|nr:MAG: hypothetical protein AVO35_10390 [Candidatus Aegiribacteria sp. MLS_C]
MAEVKHCGLVIRVSDPRQAETYKNSFDIQLQELRKHIEAKNSNKDGPQYIEFDTYNLRGISGSESFESDEFDRLRIDIEFDKVNVVMCTALDRLGRDVAGFIEFYKFLDDNDVELICTRMSLDTSTPTGEAMVVILMTLAKLELDIKSERNRRNTLYRAQEGLYNGGRPILGYNLNPNPLEAGTLIVNEKEALIVEEAFKKYMELGSDKAVSDYLTGKGYKNKSWMNRKTGKRKGGGPITENVVRTILTNVKYIALRKYSEIDESTGEVVERISNAAWQPIISEDLFYEVQSARAMAKKKKGNIAKKKPDKGHFYLIQKRAKCAACDTLLKSRSGKRHGKMYYYYSCFNDACPVSEELSSGRRSRFHIDAEEADRATYEVIEKIIASEAYIAELENLVNKSIHDEIPKLKGKLIALTNRSREIKNEVHELSRALPSFEKESNEYKLNMQQVKDQTEVLANIQDSMRKIKAILDDKQSQKVSKDEIVSLLSNMRRLAEFGPRKQREDLVKYLFRDIVVSEDKMVFNLHVNALRYIYRMSTKKGGFEQIGKWRAKRVSQRTVLWLNAGIQALPEKKPKKRFRNPLILAEELYTTMELEDLTRAELARRLGYSRARITQLLNLLNLPPELQQEISRMGDNWEKQLITERQLRLYFNR